MSARKTLLQMTEDILSDMTSDEVNGINDTEESMQVAKIIVQAYYDLHSNRNWPMDHGLVTLNALGDSTKPTHVLVDDDFTEMTGLNYDKRTLTDGDRIRFGEVKWMENDDFLRYTNGRISTEDNVDVITDPTGIKLLIKNDLAPTYYTSFDDTHIVFDSYDSEVDSTIQTSKIQAMAYKMPVFNLEDDAIPTMPIDAFSSLLNEARSRANYWLRDMQDVKSEQVASKQQRWQARKDWRVAGGIRFPNYGRRSGRVYKDPTFRRDR